MSEQTDSAVMEAGPWYPPMERRASVRIPSGVQAFYRVLGPDGAAGRARRSAPAWRGWFAPSRTAASAVRSFAN